MSALAKDVGRKVTRLCWNLQCCPMANFVRLTTLLAVVMASRKLNLRVTNLIDADPIG